MYFVFLLRDGVCVQALPALPWGWDVSGILGGFLFRPLSGYN